MNLTQGQSLALQAVQSLQTEFADGGGIVVINGFSGTGKSTLLGLIADEQKITVLTPTGKAAVRLKEINNTINSMTIHRWLYDLHEDPETGKISWNRKLDVVLPANRTIFVDEASMVTYGLFKDLRATCKEQGLNLVFVGDGFQLPPVEMEEKYRSFSIMSDDFPAHYKVKMTEIVRQALESPIIRASMELRLGGDLSKLSGLEYVLPSQLIKVGAEVTNNGGMVICHKNVTRHSLNNDIRKELGITTEMVVKGEPLLVNVNNYTLDVYNGEILNVLEAPKLLGDKPKVITDRYANESRNVWFYETHVDTPSGRAKCLIADREVFGDMGKINPRMIRRGGMELSRQLEIRALRELGPVSYTQLDEIHGTEVLNCNLGYALSVFRAQGSEAPEIIVCIENSFRLNTLDGRKMLYTALTRAKQRARLCWL